MPCMLIFKWTQNLQNGQSIQKTAYQITKDQNKEFIIFISKLYSMISQKRFLARKTKLSKAQNRRYREQSENTSIFGSFQSNILNPRSIKRYSRAQLAQISNQNNENSNSQFLFSVNGQAKSTGSKEYKLTSLQKSNSDTANNFLSCSLNENFELTSCFIDSRKSSQKIRDRPKTSLSQHSERRDESSVKPCNVVFSSKQIGIEEARISSSRALSKYSMVQRNSAISRFKVKKDKSHAPDYLSARKIVFQVKEKKQKTFNQVLKDHRNFRRFSKGSKCLEPQQFELKGWDYE